MLSSFATHALPQPAAASVPRSATGTSKQRAVFKGETLRGLLLTSYGFSDFGVKAGHAALVAYLAAALMALLGIAGFVHASYTPKTKGFAVPDQAPSNAQPVPAS